MRQLPEDLLMSQPLAMKCSLQKPEGVSTWSEQAASKFSELSAEGQTIFTIKKISTGETSVVQLFLNDEDVVPKLFKDFVTDEIPTGFSTGENDNTDTENVDVIPSTVGDVIEDENLTKLPVAVDNEPKPDSYELETVDGKGGDDTSTETFNEINKKGI